MVPNQGYRSISMATFDKGLKQAVMILNACLLIQYKHKTQSIEPKRANAGHNSMSQVLGAVEECERASIMFTIEVAQFQKEIFKAQVLMPQTHRLWTQGHGSRDSVEIFSQQ